MKFLTSLLLLSIPVASFAATFAVRDTERGCAVSGVAINGEIQRGDSKRFEEQLSKLHSKYGASDCKMGHTIVLLNSDGGDVEEAILIGNISRKNNLQVWVPQNAQCLSSCVLILAGGTTRYIIGEVGIHRPFFANLQDNKSVEYIRNERDKLNKKIKEYLKNVDVAESLLEEMLSIPPEKMKILSDADLTKFRLSGKDASQDEKEIAESASRFNISSSEYRKRFAGVDSKCKNLAMENAMRYINCFESVILQVTEEEVARRKSKIQSTCPPVNSPNRSSCYKSIFING